MLSSWFLPKKIISWEDAITSLCLDKSEMLIAYDEKVHSPSTSMDLPAVIREKRNTSRNKKAVKFSRHNVYARDHYTCQFCRNRFQFNELTYDHVVPRSRGGKTEFTNIVTACRKCNTKKGNSTCDEAGMWPMTRPVQPKTLPITSIPIDKNHAPLEWQTWLK